MDALQEIRRPIEADLERYGAMFRAALEHDNPLLHVALNHLGQRRGKQMRPMMVLLSARYLLQAHSGVVSETELPESVMHAAVALELLHTASLVHDDVVDESDRRRGQQSVNALMDNRVAVLVGDFLLSRALHHAALTGSTQVVERVAVLGQTLADGELLQLSNTDSREFSEQTYYDVIKRKTASLFSACAYCGARLMADHMGCCSETMPVVETLERYAESVGVCFQMRDDIFDYDHSTDVGKPSGNDMKEGKLTLPVLHALMGCDDEGYRQMALRVRAGEAGADDIDSLLRLTLESGGIEYAEQQMQQRCVEAQQMLTHNPQSPVTQALVRYASFVAQRSL